MIPNPKDHKLDVVHCRQGAIYFPEDLWEAMLKRLIIKRPDLVEEFKKRSLKMSSYYVLQKADQCLFYDKDKPSCCVIGEILGSHDVGSCSCFFEPQKE